MTASPEGEREGGVVGGGGGVWVGCVCVCVCVGGGGAATIAQPTKRKKEKEQWNETTATIHHPQTPRGSCLLELRTGH